MDVNNVLLVENKTFVKAIDVNETLKKLINPDKEDVFKENVEKQDIEMFMTKFRGILFDFNRELIWSFQCNFYLFFY